MTIEGDNAEVEVKDVILLTDPKPESAEEKEIRQRKPFAQPPAGEPLWKIEPIA